ncbi:ABC transporter ATP-binding protein [Stella sp.]|uniref:ABC transporter ATP-binding protein n=1 Tax=Stella sp. TaxID=2912054 RepID=UPI0035AE48B3
MTALLSVTGLTRRYGALVAVDQVDFAVAAGEVHAVIGPNGAGKSSFLAMLSGEARPDAGTIRLAGEDITRMAAAARARRGIGRAFQTTAVLRDFTVRRNALLAAVAARGRGFGIGRAVDRDPELLADARTLLAHVGLDAAADRPAGTLAHGQQRRLELAMALAGSPRLLLLDEPTAGAGPEESRAMVALLQTIRRGEIRLGDGPPPAMVLVEHDLDAVFALADRITVLAQGRVIACGPSDAVRRDRAVRQAYLGDDE